MCKCLTKAAEEYGYNKYNLEYFRKLYTDIKKNDLI